MYIITHPDFLDYDPKTLKKMILEGYPGIYIGRTSMKVGKRFSDHTATRNGKHRQLTGPFIKEYGYSFEECFAILGEGTVDEMKALENHYRPESCMGLNEKVGG